MERNVITLTATGNARLTESLLIEDPDSETMTGADIRFVDDTYDAYYDRLYLLPVAGNITASWNGATGVLTLSGQETKAGYETAIRNVVYEFRDIFSSATSEVNKVAITVSDGANVSEAVIRYVAIKNPPYTPAWLQDLEKTTLEDQSLSFSVSDFQNNYQPDTSRFTGINISNLPEHGNLLYQGNTITSDAIVSSGGSFRIESAGISQLVYQPAANYGGNDAFVWNSFDGTGLATSDALVNLVVTEVNDAPMINAPATITGIFEDSVASLTSISVGDVDDEALDVTLTVANGTLSLPENLLAGLNFFQGDGQADKILSFSSTVDNLNTALAGLTYLSDPDYAGADQLIIQVSDRIQGGDALSVSATIALTVTETNDAPILSGISLEPVTYTEDAAPIAIVPEVVVSDDQGSIVKATISVSEGFVAGEDSLSFSSKEGITATVEGEGSLLVLQGKAIVADYQQVLRSVTYKNSSQRPSTQNRLLTWQLTDEQGATSEIATRTIQVVSVNDPPVLSDLEAQTLNFVQFGSPVSISGSVSVGDIDSENLTGAVVALAEGTYVAGQDELLFDGTGNISTQWNIAAGVLTLQGTATLEEYATALRKVQYRNTSEAPDPTLRTLTLQAFNGEVASNVLSRSIAIVINEPPIIADFSKATNEDLPVVVTAEDFSVLGKYQDPDNFPDADGFARIAILTLPLHGRLVANKDTLTQAMVDNGSNGYEIPKDSLAGLTYVPASNYFGNDSLTWNAFDGAQYAEQARQLIITIAPVNDAPVVKDLSLRLNEEDTLQFALTQFTDAYTDVEAQPLQKIVIRTVPAQGTLLLNGISIPANTEISAEDIGKLIYIPAKNYNGNDSFTWTASDGEQPSAEAASVLLTLLPVNDAPIIQTFTKATADGEDIRFSSSDFTNNYLDVENDPLAFITIATLPTAGQLLLSNAPVVAGTKLTTNMISELIYRHDASMGVKDAFVWNASDGTAMSETATAFIIVGIGVADFRLTLNEDEPLSLASEYFLNNYGNPDASLQAIRVESLPMHGRLKIGDFPVTQNQVINLSNVDQLVYAPDSNYFGVDSLMWNATDGKQFSDASAYIRLDILAVNDLPQISALENITLLAGASSAPLTFTASDVETDAATLKIYVTSDNQTLIANDQLRLSGTGTNRTLVVDTRKNTSGTAHITLTVADDQQQSQTKFTAKVVPYYTTLAASKDVEVCHNEPIILSAGAISGGVAPYVYYWTCNQEDCQIQQQTYNELTITPSGSVSYYVQVTDANGIISNLDTINVSRVDCSVVDLNIPSGFTPNGDGNHDTWQIGGIEYVEDVVIQIFNRSGQRVYSTGVYTTPWDGTFNGKQLPIGTYYYIVNVEQSARIFRGSVTILR